MINKNCIKKDYVFTFLLGLLLGFICFILIYGIKVLDVTYDNWLLNGGDLTQHYIGWKFYRDSNWTFPFGLMEGLAYPLKTSIIYTDSIPIMAVLFKILSPILPTTFQYFGLWGLMCFMLQGGVSAIIIRKFTNNKINCCLGSIFFIISSTVLFRMFAHTALGAQWLILLAFAIWLYKDSFSGIKEKSIIWSIMVAFSASVHMYICAMVIGIMCGFILDELLEKNNWKENAIILFSSLSTGVLQIFLLGGFYGELEKSGGGLGFFNSNLNTLFNSFEFSNFLKSLPFATDGQYEGSAYLGLGMIILFIISIAIKIENIQFKGNVKFKVKKLIKEKSSIFSLIVISIVFGMLALSKVISFNNKILLEIKLPGFIENLLGMFRASGRFMWPVFYLIMFFSILTIITYRNKKFANLIIIICLGIQVLDLQGYMKGKHDIFTSKQTYNTTLHSEFWDNIKDDYDNIVFLDSDDILEKQENLYAFANYASENNMTLNTFYFARRYLEIDNTLVDYMEKLSNGEFDDRTIYIFNNQIINKNLYSLTFYNVDGYLIGLKLSMDINNDFISKNAYDIMPNNNKYIQDGIDEDIGRVIWSNGVSYGPYMKISQGEYKIIIEGLGLNNANFSICYNKGSDIIQYESLDQTDTYIECNFVIDKFIDDIEFKVINVGNNNITIERMYIIDK